MVCVRGWAGDNFPLHALCFGDRPKPKRLYELDGKGTKLAIWRDFSNSRGTSHKISWVVHGEDGGELDFVHVRE